MVLARGRIGGPERAEDENDFVGREELKAQVVRYEEAVGVVSNILAKGLDTSEKQRSVTLLNEWSESEEGKAADFRVRMIVLGVAEALKEEG
jgi:hypothetical protein